MIEYAPKLSLDNIRLHLGNFNDCNHSYTSQYARLYARVFEKNFLLLNAWDGSHLLNPKASVALAVKDGVVHAALSCKPKLGDDGVICSINGVVSDGGLSKIAAPLIASVLKFEQSKTEMSVAAMAYVRELDGVPNPASAKAFLKNGFLHALVKKVDVRPEHIHLTKGRGKTITVHELRAQDHDIREHGEWILRNWVML